MNVHVNAVNQTLRTKSEEVLNRPCYVFSINKDKKLFLQKLKVDIYTSIEQGY
jgi:hypothetical protein